MTVEPNMTGRGNGLAEQAPDPEQTILVAGGAGYIGCVLIPKLVERGYKVRLLDRMYFGEQGLDSVRDKIETVIADVRDIP
jgi:nucleoside-diphosphate-sugar epimerase